MKRRLKNKYPKLRGLIKTHCNTQQCFANKLGISEVALSNKLNGSVQFKQDEILKTKELFNLTPEEIDSIFFAN